ncbi:MAG: hypothetical protein GX282_08135 [Campylobacteraceae bacterium]|nr:hypothetical protein [Campylobacteraceae bacterium]
MSNVKTISLFLGLAFVVVGLGIYIGDALFGERSYSVLKELQKEKTFLYKDISRLEEENAKLQKTYLERVTLDPDVKF